MIQACVEKQPFGWWIETFGYFVKEIEIKNNLFPTQMGF